MKKTVSILLLVVLMFGLALCFSACDDSSHSSSPSYSYSPKILTESEKEDIAEDEALYKISQRYPFSGDGTKYKIGSKTTRSDGKVVLKGQLFTYDAYGKYEDSYTFTAIVSVDDYGSAELEDFDYKLQ